MIETKNLSFGYNKHQKLYKSLNLRLQKGSIYGLLGKNGAGKSTLLKIICGLLFPKTGDVTVNGFKPSKREPAFLESIYFIPEEVDVPPLTIKKYLWLFKPFYPNFDETAFFQYLQEMEINQTGKLSELSFGQQKKFIIAFGLACNTALLIMDEPTNGLDIPSKSWFRKLIASVLNDERIIIISTHQVRDLDNLIDQVIVLDEGNLLLQASIVKICEKLSFKVVSQIDPQSNLLYHESSLKGHSIVSLNPDMEDTKINLEHLFNAVIQNPTVTKNLFNT